MVSSDHIDQWSRRSREQFGSPRLSGMYWNGSLWSRLWSVLGSSDLGFCVVASSLIFDVNLEKTGKSPVFRPKKTPLFLVKKLTLWFSPNSHHRLRISRLRQKSKFDVLFTFQSRDPRHPISVCSSHWDDPRISDVERDIGSSDLDFCVSPDLFIVQCEFEEILRKSGFFG